MSDNKEEEIWKTFPEYDFIEVSNLGRVRTKDRYVPGRNGSKRLVKGRILKQSDNGCGYLQVHFRVNGKPVNLFVHRIVATCFIPNPGNLPEVNHIDCDPANNTVSNLEWCTSQYNSAYRDKLGHTAKHNAPKKPVIAIKPEASKIFWFESQREAERQLGVNQSSIVKVVKDKQSKAGDYWFCYADKNAVEKVRKRFGDELARKVEELMSQNKN